MMAKKAVWPHKVFGLPVCSTGTVNGHGYPRINTDTGLETAL